MTVITPLSADIMRANAVPTILVVVVKDADTAHALRQEIDKARVATGATEVTVYSYIAWLMLCDANRDITDADARAQADTECVKDALVSGRHLDFMALEPVVGLFLDGFSAGFPFMQDVVLPFAKMYDRPVFGPKGRI